MMSPCKRMMGTGHVPQRLNLPAGNCLTYYHHIDGKFSEYIKFTDLPVYALRVSLDGLRLESGFVTRGMP